MSKQSPESYAALLHMELDSAVEMLVDEVTLHAVRGEISEILGNRGLSVLKVFGNSWLVSPIRVNEDSNLLLGFCTTLENILIELRKWRELLPESIRSGFHFGAWVDFQSLSQQEALFEAIGVWSSHQHAVCVADEVVKPFLTVLPETWESHGDTDIYVGPGVTKEQESYRVCWRQSVVDGVSGRTVAYRFVMKGVTLGEIEVSRATDDDARIGRFTLVSILGVGGMGQVWKARDQFGNFVALKMMLPGNVTTQSQIERFQREAKVMSKLAHRNICRIMEVGEADGVSFIAMELIDGISLHQLLTIPIEGNEKEKQSAPDVTELIRRIRSENDSSTLEKVENKEAKEDSVKRKKIFRILPVQQTLSLITQIASALQFAHEHGIMHRDLKPANIMLREDGEPVVMDFGLAKLNVEEKDTQLTLSGMMVGTVQFMSPEQALSSADVDERADVYSAGAILYQMLTGKPHFTTSGNILKDAQNLQEHVPERLRNINRSIEADLEIIVLKALQPDPGRRYRNMQALKDDLERYRHGEVIQAKPVTLLDIIGKTVKRNKALTAVSLLSVTLFLFLGVAFVFRLQREKSAALASEKLAQEKQVEAEKNALELKKTLELVQKREQEANEARDLADKRADELKLTLAQLNQEQTKRQDTEKIAEKAIAQVSQISQEAEQTEAALREVKNEKEKLKKEAEEAKSALTQTFTPFEPRYLKPEPLTSHQIVARVDEIMNNVYASGEYGIREATSRALQRMNNLSSQPNQVSELYLAMGKIYLSNLEIKGTVESLRKAVSLKDGNVTIKNEALAILNMLNDCSRVREDLFEEANGDASIDKADLIRGWKKLAGESRDNALIDLASGGRLGGLGVGDKIALIRLKRDITEGKL